MPRSTTPAVLLFLLAERTTIPVDASRCTASAPAKGGGGGIEARLYDAVNVSTSSSAPGGGKGGKRAAAKSGGGGGGGGGASGGDLPPDGFGPDDDAELSWRTEKRASTDEPR